MEKQSKKRNLKKWQENKKNVLDSRSKKATIQKS